VVGGRRADRHLIISLASVGRFFILPTTTPTTLKDERRWVIDGSQYLSQRSPLKGKTTATKIARRIYSDQQRQQQ